MRAFFSDELDEVFDSGNYIVVFFISQVDGMV